MPGDGLDEEKLRTLARWGAGLRTDGRAEVAAAGRAIEMLIEEIERLHVLLWDQRLYPASRSEAPASTPIDHGTEPAESAAGDADATIDQTLRDRLAYPWRRHVENPQT